MERETLASTLIVVTDPLGNEVEVSPDDMFGSMDEETSQSLMIGRAVRSALMTSIEDGATVYVRIYYK